MLKWSAKWHTWPRWCPLYIRNLHMLNSSARWHTWQHWGPSLITFLFLEGGPSYTNLPYLFVISYVWKAVNKAQNTASMQFDDEPVNQSHYLDNTDTPENTDAQPQPKHVLGRNASGYYKSVSLGSLCPIRFMSFLTTHEKLYRHTCRAWSTFWIGTRS